MPNVFPKQSILYAMGMLPSVSRFMRALTLCAACGIVWLGDSASMCGQKVVAQDGQQPGIPEDDPFADELNPFGSGTPVPRTTPTRPPGSPTRPTVPEKPPLQLAVPFPDRTIPGEPAERRRPSQKKPSKEFDDAPAPPDRVRAKQPPSRDDMRPFPEADEPEDDNDGVSEAVKLLAKAERLDKQDKLEEARTMLREVIRLDPELAIAYLALGVVSRRLGDFKGSVEACSSGLRIDPQNAELYLRRGIAWFHLGLYGIAIEDFEDAAGIAYDDPRPELWRGLTLVQLNRPLEAINAYASSIRRDRTYMIAYLNRGLAYLATDESRKAEFDFDHAIRHNPRDLRAWFNRGVAQARQGRYQDAIESYSAALKIDPAHEPSRRNLDEANRLSGILP
ncbi:MAG: tetratricopeptide repeat protein [Planctomycetota bacterium]